MTVREATALVMLFKSCTDPIIRRRVLKLVPDLKDFHYSEDHTALIDELPLQRY